MGNQGWKLTSVVTGDQGARSTCTHSLSHITNYDLWMVGMTTTRVITRVSHRSVTGTQDQDDTKQ